MRIKGGASIIIILGQALYKNDSIGSISMLPSHESRVKKGYNIYNDLHVDDVNNTRIIVTGGDTKQYNITEASIMRQKLISLHGNTSIDNIIMLEEDASNTVENAINCYKMIKSNNDFDNNCTIHVVSNEYHIPRVRCIFKCVFEENPQQCYKLCYHSADSRLKRTGQYRQTDKREGHPDINWLLCERLDWEHNALLTLNEYLKKFKLNAHISDINDALNKLRTLNETLK